MTPELHPYQKDGIEFLGSRKRAVLADDPGLGKSVQVIRAAETIGAQRMIVFCPAIGRISWVDQFQRWQTNGAPTIIWHRDRARLGLPDGPLNLIVTYDLAARPMDKEQLMFMMKRFQPFDVAVLDECHYLKNRTAKRTKAIYSPRLDLSKTGLLHYLADDASIWLLSGTPFPNHFGEFFTHARTLFPEFCKNIFHQEKINFSQWIATLCNVRKGNWGDEPTSTKSAMRPIIKKELKPLLLRRQKSLILSELTDPQHFDTPVEMKLPEHWDADMRRRLTDAGWDGSDETIVGALRLLMNTQEALASERSILGQAKAEAAVEWISEYLNNAPKDEKMIVFYHHRAVGDILMDGLEKFGAVRFDGGTNQRDREDAVHRFQNDKKVRVFAGQTLAAGTSITLTAASTVVVCEADWVPANMNQAISRAHRLGQKGQVMVYWLQAPNTLDARITSALSRKTRDVAKTLGDCAA